MLHKQSKKNSKTMQQRKNAGKEASKLSVQVLQVLRGQQQSPCYKRTTGINQQQPKEN
jgi:hypothetical protein